MKYYQKTAWTNSTTYIFLKIRELLILNLFIIYICGLVADVDYDRTFNKTTRPLQTATHRTPTVSKH